jgi:hypothetical protein
MHCVWNFLSDHLEVSSPHITASKLDSAFKSWALFFHFYKKLSKTGARPALSNP